MFLLNRIIRLIITACLCVVKLFKEYVFSNNKDISLKNLMRIILTKSRGIIIIILTKKEEEDYGEDFSIMKMEIN